MVDGDAVATYKLIRDQFLNDIENYRESQDSASSSELLLMEIVLGVGYSVAVVSFMVELIWRP